MYRGSQWVLSVINEGPTTLAENKNKNYWFSFLYITIIYRFHGRLSVVIGYNTFWLLLKLYLRRRCCRKTLLFPNFTRSFVNINYTWVNLPNCYLWNIYGKINYSLLNVFSQGSSTAQFD